MKNHGFYPWIFIIVKMEKDMSKIKVTADIVLEILKGIMGAEEINYKITDKSAPKEWQGKTIQDVLNIEYYTFRHRPMNTEAIISDLLKQKEDANVLYSLERSFGLLSLGKVDRVFSKDNDIVTVPANLEYWIQSSKIKLLEDLVDDMARETVGIRIPVQIGKENRQVIIALSNLEITEIQEATEFGEMAVGELNVDLLFYPDVTSRTDYQLEFLVDNAWVKLPFSSLTFSSSMTQKAAPYMNNPKNVGSINLSKVKSMVVAFDGYNNSFVDFVTNASMQSDVVEGEDHYDNNTTISTRVTRKDEVFLYDFVIKDHNVIVQEDTGNETHSLTLTTGGYKDGTT